MRQRIGHARELEAFGGAVDGAGDVDGGDEIDVGAPWSVAEAAEAFVGVRRAPDQEEDGGGQREEEPGHPCLRIEGRPVVPLAPDARTVPDACKLAGLITCARIHHKLGACRYFLTS
jgi:hypothetical protein